MYTGVLSAVHLLLQGVEWLCVCSSVSYSRGPSQLGMPYEHVSDSHCLQRY
jgi:hypothetical protein